MHDSIIGRESEHYQESDAYDHDDSYDSYDYHDISIGEDDGIMM